MIWGYPYFRKHPYTSSDSTSVSKNRIKESWLTVKFLVEICAKQNSNDRVHAVCLGQNEICITGRVLVILNLLQATGSSNKCWQTKPCNCLHQAKSTRAVRALNWYRSRKDKCSIEGWYSGLFFSAECACYHPRSLLMAMAFRGFRPFPQTLLFGVSSAGLPAAS